MKPKKKPKLDMVDRQEEETLKAIAPQLFSMKKRSPFHLKDGEELELKRVWEDSKHQAFSTKGTDFQGLQEKVFESIEVNSSKKKQVKILQLLAWSAAAAIIIAVAVSFFDENKSCDTFACLLKESEFSEAELLTLVEDSEDELLLLFEEEELNFDSISDDELMELMEDPELEIEELWYE